MFFIGICDDDELQRQHIKKLCEQFFIDNKQEYKCIEFASGEEVLQFTECKLHLLFLDIEMGDMNGIDVLHKIEDIDLVWRVVFISSHEEFVFDTFGIKTLGFVRKPAEYGQMARWLRIAIKENKENIMYECSINNQICYKALESIYYLEAAGNYTYLHEKKEKHLVSDKLKVWQEKMVQTPMVRIHKSYLINMLHVKRWEREGVILSNGTELTLGRQYRKAAKEIYLAFVQNQAKGRM